MRIGMILDKEFPPDPRVENEAVSLIKDGHQVFLYALDYTGLKKSSELVNGINVCRVKVHPWVYSLSALAYTIPLYHKLLQRNINKFLLENDIEVIHVHDMQIARPIFKINEKLQLPIVLDLHENRPEIMKEYSHVKSFLGKLLIYSSIWKHYEAKYIKQATYTIVVTEEAKKYYIDRDHADKDKIIVLPNTVRKEFFNNYKTDDRILEKYDNNFVLLYLGDTGLRRGILTMIDSLHILIKEIPNIKLVCVGSSKSDEYLRKYVKENGLENYVELTGWQDFNLFQSYINSSNICISPIHRNIHHDTTFANKIFQYLSLKKPIIVSDSTAQANFVQDNNCGLIFKDQDSNDLAKKVLLLYKDNLLYTKLSTNGEKAIGEQYNWENTSKQLLSMYNRFGN